MDRMTDRQNLVELRAWLRGRGANAWHDRPSALAWPVVLFLFISTFVAVDLAADVRTGVGIAHIGIELVALAMALAGVVVTALKLRDAIRRAHELGRDLEGTRADLARWREEAEGFLRGLSTTIDQQFEEWRLSSAEREVAWLILKGLSYKEVAEVRRTTERTVRHQAIAVYRKAGLAGRAEMAAFFLEDLLEPRRAPAEVQAMNDPAGPAGAGAEVRQLRS